MIWLHHCVAAIFIAVPQRAVMDTNMILLQWCREGECIPVNKETPEPIDGNWDDWSAWTPCTRTCGGGVKSRQRYCTNPRLVSHCVLEFKSLNFNTFAA